MADLDPAKLREQASRQLHALEAMRGSASRQQAVADEMARYAATIEQRVRRALATLGLTVADEPLDVEATRSLLEAHGG